jgi:Lar family restriction alleviation protein
MAELKPCPFCGRVPSKVREYKVPSIRGVFYTVQCKAPKSKCGIKPTTSFCDSKEKAIEAWNRRVDKVRRDPI